MVFLVDKYKVNDNFDIKFNKHIYDQLIYSADPIIALNKLSEQLKSAHTKETINKCFERNYYMNGLTDDQYRDRYVNLPNLFVYGPSGSGKKTFIRILLESMFNKTINNTTRITHQILGYGNSAEDKDIDQSNFHIIIEPDNSGFDRYVMQEIISEYAQHAPLRISGCQTPFKVVLINNADNLSPYAQKALRCTMEKYHRTCKFILCCNQASKVIRALRSRCLQIRMARPTDIDVFNIIYDVSCKENIYINKQNIRQIVYLARRNMKTAYSLLDIYKSNINSIDIHNNIDECVYMLSWIESLQKIIDIIRSFYEAPIVNKIFCQNTLDIIRELLYTIFITNVSGNTMIMQFMILMIRSIKFDPKLFPKIMQTVGTYEARITKGKKIVIHMEALIMNIMYQIQLFKMSDF